ncbi:alkaline phosphatase D family protein [Robertkochia aurantiaca]|uniref:alkaline phosphatase D family protein n=1 Tax=Robertkochia aurantiaca TaxID=2873700 RepID=UPI001CC93DD9|nr:alkaline phosphatase D family protein [Robertkochia sp. 3YJGBD-33]
MNRLFLLFLALPLLSGCGASKTENLYPTENGKFIMAFGSCNVQDKPNYLWDDVLKNDPQVWVWGGDNIYADTYDMREMRKMYEEQRYQKGYREVKDQMLVTGTWDDHDYGLNDGGEDYEKKEESQDLFLDFMDVPKKHIRRARKGVYSSHVFPTREGKVRLINLDTRYFRSPLTKNLGEENKRYMPAKDGRGTILGEEQWEWLEKELMKSDATFNVIMSSIQVLSDEHGYETWGNFPHERKRLFDLIEKSGARGVIIVSGDRHISEFSQINLEGLPYPLIDFTSSGLNRAWSDFPGEENPYRVGEVINMESFGLLELDLIQKSATMKMKSNGNLTLQELKQAY